MLNTILESNNYNREMLYQEYAQYSNGQETLYLFRSEAGEVVVSLQEKRIMDEYRLCEYLNIKLDSTQIDHEETQELSMINYESLYTTLYQLSNSADKPELFHDDKGRKCSLLYRDGELKGHAVQKGKQTNFICNDLYACWSLPLNDLEKNKKAMITSNINIIHESHNDYNYILTQPDYNSIGYCIQKIGYSNMRFKEPYTWFLGNIYHLNSNTPNYINIVNRDSFLLLETKNIECLKEYQENESAFIKTYSIESGIEIFKKIIEEIANKYNIELVEYQIN